jgi:hypothetical protein
MWSGKPEKKCKMISNWGKGCSSGLPIYRNASFDPMHSLKIKSFGLQVDQECSSKELWKIWFHLNGEKEDKINITGGIAKMIQRWKLVEAGVRGEEDYIIGISLEID